MSSSRKKNDLSRGRDTSHKCQKLTSPDRPTQHNTKRNSETGNKQTIMHGLRAIVCSELINGPFLLFPWVENNALTAVSLYTEYFVKNKIHHIDIQNIKSTFIKEKHSLLMILTNQNVYDSVLHGNGDISASLHNGDTHVMEFECYDGDDYMALLQQLETLSLYRSDSKVVTASTKDNTYERLYPEVFYAWKESGTYFFSQIKNIMAIAEMHLFLEERRASVLSQSSFFSYPIKSHSDLKSDMILHGMIHIQSVQDKIISVNEVVDRGICVSGATVERLISDGMLDDCLIHFWFKW